METTVERPTAEHIAKMSAWLKVNKKEAEKLLHKESHKIPLNAKERDLINTFRSRTKLVKEFGRGR